MRARDLLTEDQLAVVRERHDWKSMALIAHAWAIIFAAMALFAWWPNPLTFLIAAVLVAGRQLGLSVLMHEGSHGLLLRDYKWNMRLSQWFCAWPVGVDTRTYRTYHLKHHARTQQDDDPDLILSKPFPVTRKSLWRKVLRDLTGQTGIAQRKAQIVAAFGKADWPWRQRLDHATEKLGGIALANLVLFAGLAIAGYWWFYPVLWLVPLLTVFQLILRIRNIAEHAMVGDKDDLFANARTTLAGPLARLVLAPYWVNYHVEHHVLMWVPCYNLEKFHRFLRDGPHGDKLLVNNSYAEVLRLVATRPFDDDGDGSKVHTEHRRYAGIMMEDEVA